MCPCTWALSTCNYSIPHILKSFLETAGKFLKTILLFPFQENLQFFFNFLHIIYKSSYSQNRQVFFDGILENVSKLSSEEVFLVTLLTLKDPFISESCIEIKIELNFHTSLAFIKPFEAPQRSVK